MSSRRDDITGKDRAQIALRCLAAGERRDGTRAALMAEYGLTRQSIHHIMVQAQAALAEVLAPKGHGPVAKAHGVAVTPGHVLRTIAVLRDCAVSERKIGECLEQILGYTASLGWISGRVSELEQRAAQVNASWRPAIQESLAADEIYCQGVPNLLVVGSESLYIYALTQQDGQDGDTWGCVFLDVPMSAHVARDGGKGLCAGANLVGQPGQMDWWHVLHQVWCIDASREQAVYRAMEQLDERADFFDRAHTTVRLTQHLARWEKASQHLDEAVADYERYHELAQEVNELFAMINLDNGQVVDQAMAIFQLQRCAEQIRDLGGRACGTVATTLNKQARWLFAYVPRLTAALVPLQAHWGDQAVAALCRMWQVDETTRRCHLSRTRRQQLNAIWQASFETVAQLLGDDLFEAWEDVQAVLGANWRTSSAAECVNSLLRPYFNAHRSTHQGALELRRFMHNSHTFARGKRAGLSPAQLVGISLPPDPLTLLRLPVTTLM